MENRLALGMRIVFWYFSVVVCFSLSLSCNSSSQDEIVFDVPADPSMDWCDRVLSGGGGQQHFAVDMALAHVKVRTFAAENTDGTLGSDDLRRFCGGAAVGCAEG